jgi:hypothetical protein
MPPKRQSIVNRYQKIKKMPKNAKKCHHITPIYPQFENNLISYKALFYGL